MKRLAVFVILFIVGLTLSCSRGVKNLETGMIMSNNIYEDIAPQVVSALESPSADSTRTERLRLINEKLGEYRKAYAQCTRAVDMWRSTGEAPENVMDLYMGMWKPLIDAQTLAASVYIYASECTARTSLKGKACQ